MTGRFFRRRPVTRSARLAAEVAELTEAERAARESLAMPARHPEWLTAELGRADEEMLAALASDLWKHDEYLEIVAEDYRQRNGGDES